jgi:hypothetical protein
MASRNRYKDSDARIGREPGQFVTFPQAVLHSPAFKRLSAHAVKLLLDLLSQFKGNNNGDLCAAWKLMEKRGWKSRETLNKARKELLSEDLITLTRQGGMHQASLYAVTFRKIDPCEGKSLEVRPTRTPPPARWRNNQPAVSDRPAVVLH